MEYIAYLLKDRHSEFDVSFPDFPGCVTSGDTLDDALRNASEALASHIEEMIQEGERIPDPSALDDLANDPAMKDAVVFLVSVGIQTDRTVRFNVTAREGQLKAIDERARSEGLTRSAYMVRSSLGVETLKWRPPRRKPAA